MFVEQCNELHTNKLNRFISFGTDGGVNRRHSFTHGAETLMADLIRRPVYMQPEPDTIQNLPDYKRFTLSLCCVVPHDGRVDICIVITSF
jgi:hypothetical protein